MNRDLKHILILNQYYPPDTSATAKMVHMIVSALSEQYIVTVLAGRPSYNPLERHGWKPWSRSRQGNIIIERVGSTTYSRVRMWSRVANYMSYLFLAIPRALAINADVIIAMTDPPLVGGVGALIARVRHRPFLYNIRDLHPDMALTSGMIQSSRWVELWERFHQWVLQQADRIIVLGDDMRERIIAKNIASDRVTVIRDGVPLSENTSLDEQVVQEIRCGYQFVVLHAGNLGFYGAWETVIEAAKLLKDDGVGFVFVGAGAAKSRVEALAKTCSHVRFLPFRPPSEIPSVLAAGDIHIVTMLPGTEGVVVPSKLYSILAAGRPILAIASDTSDVSRIVSESRCGVVVSPDQPGVVAARIRDLIQDQKILHGMARHARAIAPRYEWQKQIDRFIRVIEETVSIK